MGNLRFATADRDEVSQLKKEDNSIKIGIQLIIYGEAVTSQCDVVFKEVSDLGFAGIEIGPTCLAEQAAGDIRAKADRFRLCISGYHCGIKSIATEEETRRTSETVTQLGTDHLICSGVLGGGRRKENYFATAALMSDRAAQLDEDKIRLHYHHHDWELLQFLGDTTGIEYLLSNSPQSIGIVLDTYWAVVGEAQLSWLWEKAQGRCSMVHLKDGIPSERQFCALGDGIAGAKQAVDFLRKKDLSWLIYEQDLPDYRSASECVMRSRRWLKEELGR